MMIFNYRTTKMAGDIISRCFSSGSHSYINISIKVPPVLLQSTLALLRNTLDSLVKEDSEAVNLRVSDEPFTVSSELVGHNDDNAFGGEV